MKKLLMTAAVLAALTAQASASEWWTHKSPVDLSSECVRAGTDFGVLVERGKIVPFKSPADLFEAGGGWGYLQPKLVDKGDEVVVAVLTPWAAEFNLRSHEEYHFYRTQEACEGRRKAFQDSSGADLRRMLEEIEKRARDLDKYR